MKNAFIRELEAAQQCAHYGRRDPASASTAMLPLLTQQAACLMAWPHLLLTIADVPTQDHLGVESPPHSSN